MTYRNGTYIAFHAEGNTNPTASDIRYYRMMMAWRARDGSSFPFYNSHEKVPAVRSTSMAETIRRSLRLRLDNSKNMVLIVGQRTRLDNDFVPYEIGYAVDTCKIPIIAAYPGQGVIRSPEALRSLWPDALRQRIDSGRASVIHVPFHRKTIENAIWQFNHNNFPTGGGLGIYSDVAYREFGLL